MRALPPVLHADLVHNIHDADGLDCRIRTAQELTLVRVFVSA
jgi:hypothetical protein